MHVDSDAMRKGGLPVWLLAALPQPLLGLTLGLAMVGMFSLRCSFWLRTGGARP